MIVVIDYGMGNIGTVATKIKKMTESVFVSSKPVDILNADKLILPGVGSFKSGMDNLRSRNLIDPLHKAVLEKKIPILGICLGMQLFSKKSEEGYAEGLGWINAETIRFRFDGVQNGLKIPHMGWNTIHIRSHHPLLQNIDDQSRFYFIHSYHIKCNIPGNIVATSEYGYPFASIISLDNIIGVQFHPERSHKNGMQILKNFIGED